MPDSKQSFWQRGRFGFAKAFGNREALANGSDCILGVTAVYSLTEPAAIDEHSGTGLQLRIFRTHHRASQINAAG